MLENIIDKDSVCRTPLKDEYPGLKMGDIVWGYQTRLRGRATPGDFWPYVDGIVGTEIYGVLETHFGDESASAIMQTIAEGTNNFCERSYSEDENRGLNEIPKDEREMTIAIYSDGENLRVQIDTNGHAWSPEAQIESGEISANPPRLLIPKAAPGVRYKKRKFGFPIMGANSQYANLSKDGRTLHLAFRPVKMAYAAA